MNLKARPNAGAVKLTARFNYKGLYSCEKDSFNSRTDLTWSEASNLFGFSSKSATYWKSIEHGKLQGLGVKIYPDLYTIRIGYFHNEH